MVVLADSNTENNYEQQDQEILENYHKPKADENFEDNTINIILKSGFSGKIGFNDFKCVDEIWGIKSITYKLNTIYKGSTAKFDIDKNKNAILSIKLLINNKIELLKAIDKIAKLDIVLVAEPNYIYETISCWTPNDAGFSKQWGLNGRYGIDAENAWNIIRGSNNVKVGIFEDGADFNHEDLSGQIFNGNFIGSSNNEHGTHVAGIIGAKHNSVGVAGISNVTMHLLNASTFVSSLEYATENNIKLINASFGFIDDYGKYLSYNATHFTAIKNYNGLLICAAGNDTINTDITPLYPACYELPNIISVGNIMSSGKPSLSSNYGNITVDIYAPGTKIISTFPTEICLKNNCNTSSHHSNGYHYMSGTSMSAPHVTGVAALLLSLNVNISASKIREIILDSADIISISSNETILKLNAYRAVATVKNILDSNKNKTFYFKFDRIHAMESSAYPLDNAHLGFNNSFTLTAPENMTHLNDSGTKDVRNFTHWRMILNGPNAHDVVTNPWIDFTTDRTLSFTVSDIINNYYPLYETTETIYFRAVYKTSPPSSSCIAEDSLITLADGSRKLVKDLTGEESLLVWNLFTGTFDSAPILCIDSETAKLNDVINLYFSDGTNVNVISEHGFWDIDENKYVYLDKYAAEYIGHTFYKQDIVNNELYSTEVELTDVVIEQEYTTAFSPVTYGHLCYFVNGMLSMPGGIDGLFNIFEVDRETFKYDEAAYLNDIETYGLYTYQEFSEILLVSEELFEAVNGQYLKVATGKGLVDIDTLAEYIERYSALFD